MMPEAPQSLNSLPELFPEPSTAVEFPRPTLERWQPLRSGILNLFRFECEEFHFADGRLLLRGNNGSGKSRVLALQLPFLLDGEVSPHRIEPDGDPAKRLEWNLLMDRYPDRLGYTWIEFGRRLEDGTESYLTLGCGLRATQGRGLHSRWFFTTEARHGRDFFLQTESGQPLTREALEETIGPSGHIYRNAREYRQAVDDALFRLGPRYDSLVELLIRLRQPQLSRKLDEQLLSGALSEALAPLSDTLIDEVAESFRGLEADREELDGYTVAGEAVEEFLHEYRHYIRIAARRRAERVRTTHSAYESSQRAFREAEREAQEAQRREAELAEHAARLANDLAAAREAVDTLRASPEMRRAEEVDRARHDAETADKRLHQTQIDLESARQRNDRATAERAEQLAFESEVAASLHTALAQSEKAAHTAGLQSQHTREIPATVAAAPEGLDSIRARQRLESLISNRRQASTHLEKLNAEVEQAARKLDQAESARRRAVDDLSEARVREREARQELERAGESLLNAYRDWVAGLTELKPVEAESLAEALFEWVERREGESPVACAIEAARDSAQNQIAREHQRAETARTDILTALTETETALEQLEEGGHTPPLPFRTRPAPRINRPGAPFWKTCDFRADTPMELRAGLEAALEAAGLLDAWLLPDGVLIDPKTEDAFLLDSDGKHPLPAGRSLSHWLVPTVDREDPAAAAVDDAVVTRLLERLGGERDAGSHWVSPDGGWQLGPLAGHWSKPEAEHIGESSRAAARRRRIAELRDQLDRQQHELHHIEQVLETLAGRRHVIHAELRRAPSDQPVLEAGYQLTESVRQLTRAEEEHSAREHAAAESRRAWESMCESRNSIAADLDLSQWIDRLQEFREALGEYAAALASVWPQLANWHRARAQSESAHLRLENARQEYARRENLHREAGSAASAARQHYETLEAAQGQEARIIMERLRGAESHLESVIAAEKQNQDDRVNAAVARERASGTQKHHASERDRHAIERDEAIGALRRFAENRLLAEAHEDLQEVESTGWAVSRAVEIARRTDQLLHDVGMDDAAWNRRQQFIYRHTQELRDRLVPHGFPPDLAQLDDVTVARVHFRGRPCSMTELFHALAAEVAERRRLLDAREREVIENHLLGEAATELQRLLRAAENWVAETNRELANRPTSTGMLLKFVWEPEPDGPPGLESARKQLLRTTDLWTPEEREGLARFLQERIQAERTENPATPWRNHLAAALDYRRWHRFAIERCQDGQWRRLTRRTYGTGSGGEKAIALTLPQFAAASAHYRTAAPEAPRLILLDEVFVGIDTDMRAKCMELLRQFDLDFVMTSEREWGCYASMPALSIYHLSTRPGFDTVAVTRWRWNGRELAQDKRPMPPGKQVSP